MTTLQEAQAVMDRLISENEALAYRLPMPPVEVTDGVCQQSCPLF